MTRKLIPVLALFLLMAGVAGCGAGRKYAISGTITRGGEKLTWPDGGTLLVVYVAEDLTRSPNTFPAETDTATSTYRIAAIPPGRYTVAVQQFDTKFMDALGGVYDPGHTSIAREVTQDGQVIDIDLPKDLPKRSVLPGGKAGKQE